MHISRRCGCALILSYTTQVTRTKAKGPSGTTAEIPQPQSHVHACGSMWPHVRIPNVAARAPKPRQLHATARSNCAGPAPSRCIASLIKFAGQPDCSRAGPEQGQVQIGLLQQAQTIACYAYAFGYELGTYLFQKVRNLPELVLARARE